MSFSGALSGRSGKTSGSAAAHRLGGVALPTPDQQRAVELPSRLWS